jgi:hypothetical protein
VKNVNVFVTAGDEQADADGSINKPYGHIVKALDAGYDTIADYSGGVVNVYLLKGNHFMTRNYRNYYFGRNKLNQYAFNVQVTIQPIF